MNILGKWTISKVLGRNDSGDIVWQTRDEIEMVIYRLVRG